MKEVVANFDAHFGVGNCGDIVGLTDFIAFASHHSQSCS
jgi:hypothetical protein